jgi:hypothetical protein
VPDRRSVSSFRAYSNAISGARPGYPGGLEPLCGSWPGARACGRSQSWPFGRNLTLISGVSECEDDKQRSDHVYERDLAAGRLDGVLPGLESHGKKILP